jgi:hypothetical protein
MFPVKWCVSQPPESVDRLSFVRVLMFACAHAFSSEAARHTQQRSQRKPWMLGGYSLGMCTCVWIRWSVVPPCRHVACLNSCLRWRVKRTRQICICRCRDPLGAHIYTQHTHTHATHTCAKQLRVSDVNDYEPAVCAPYVANYYRR